MDHCTKCGWVGEKRVNYCPVCRETSNIDELEASSLAPYKLSDQRGKHKGAIIAVLGGGPSLPADLKKIATLTYTSSKPIILISVNHHASYLVNCDYIVFWDDPTAMADAYEAQLKYKGRRFARTAGFNDFERDCKIFYSGTSSTIATWFAWHLGAELILLAGMDCYQGADYHYRRKGYSAEKETSKSLEAHLTPWKNTKSFLDFYGFNNTRAVSGPLVDIFGGWQYE